MKELVKAGLLALLEGDRDSLLNLFPYESDDPTIIWLKASSVEEMSERMRLLQKIIQTPTPEFKSLAIKIIERENKYKALLNIPPSYKFWIKRDQTLMESEKDLF